MAYNGLLNRSERNVRNVLSRLYLSDHSPAMGERPRKSAHAGIKVK